LRTFLVRKEAHGAAGDRAGRGWARFGTVLVRKQAHPAPRRPAPRRPRQTEGARSPSVSLSLPPDHVPPHHRRPERNATRHRPGSCALLRAYGRNSAGAAGARAGVGARAGDAAGGGVAATASWRRRRCRRGEVRWRRVRCWWTAARGRVRCDAPARFRAGAGAGFGAGAVTAGAGAGAIDAGALGGSVGAWPRRRGQPTTRTMAARTAPARATLAQRMRCRRSEVTPP
jgi:hypothetical protein